ncbi:nickel ABC transporter substrate-binding protein [Phytohalomonas tamaricis]|uniref:nickel ABC transporter substrate-binding protein n=1 Tax=Phytohalomonas tamaricis TaxID=2081032 RepID=UPI0021D42CE1|nr:nickel ABC transporter substrate-binding protein [Phytohalomonas tamaricis]
MARACTLLTGLAMTIVSLTLGAMTLGISPPARAAQDAARILTYSWPSNAGPLDPQGYGANQMYAQAMLYEPLVRYRADGTIAPWLATAWQISADGKRYTFTLRDDVTFSDGTPFDAAAVKANIVAVLANRKHHDWLELVAQIDRAEVVDEHTVRLVLKHAYYPTLQELALIRPLRFASPKVLEADGHVSAPVGTGPWQLAESRRGEFDLFTRNPHYWGPKPAYEAVKVKVIGDANTRAIALQTGQIDLVQGADGQISADTFERFKASGQFKTAVSPPLATRVLTLNSKRAPTRDLAVRQAIEHAIDKDSIVAKLLYGLEPRADTLFAPSFPYADLGLAPYRYDPVEAERLLEADGWMRGADGIRHKDGQPLEIGFYFVGSDAQQKAIAEVVQAELKRVGIDVRLAGEEANSISARQKSGEFGMVFSETWGAPYDPHSYVSSMRAPSHADYQAQLGLPMKAKLDREIGEVLTSTDEDTRQALYRDILTTLHQQAVYVPISYITAISVSRPGVAGVGFGATINEIPFEQMHPATP